MNRTFNLVEQQKGDNGILTDNYNRLVRAVRMLMNFQPDPRFFDYSFDTTGHYLTFREPLGDTFPWDKLQFGWTRTLLGAADVTKIQLLTGNVRNSIKTSVTIAAVDVSVGVTDTWIGIRIKRNLTSGSVITGASLADMTPDTDWFKCWFYIFKQENGIAQPQNYNLGQIMDVDITGYGD